MAASIENHRRFRNLMNEVRSARDTTEQGRRFEAVSDYALRNSMEHRADIATIERWEVWAKRTHPEWTAQSRQDNGVDRIITTHDGKIWAVQNKGYQRGSSARHGDVTNFKLQADLAKADLLIWVTSGDGLSDKSRKILSDAGVDILVHDEEWLRSAAIYPETIAELSTRTPEPPPPPHVLREDQKEAVTAIVRTLAGEHSCQYISACGTGKTVTSYGVHVALESQATVFFVPTLGLMKQSIESWTRQAGPGGLDIIAVCSDEEVVHAGLNNDKDTEAVKPESLGRLWYRTAERFAAGVLHTTGTRPLVVFCTYQSAHVVIDAQHDHDVKPFDLAINDEAHNLAGSGAFGEAVLAKDDGRRRLKSGKRVYMTATPKVIDKSLRGKTTADSMDKDSKVFGPRAYTMTFGKAIDLGLLAPYQVYILSVPDEQMKTAIERNRTVVSTEFRSDAKMLASAIAVERAIESFGDRLFVSYHNRVSDARKFTELVSERGRVKYAETIYGKQKSDARSDIVDRFLDEPSSALISNVRCLNEGVDFQALNAIVFVDPKEGLSTIVQSVGRVLRTSEGKECGRIIIPIPVSADEAAELTDLSDIAAVSEKVRKDSRWGTVFHVLQALAEHDTVLQENISRIARDGFVVSHHGVGLRDFTGAGGSRVTFATVDGIGGLDDEYIERMSRTLAVCAVGKMKWMVSFGEFTRWVSAHGTWPSTIAADLAEKRLGQWLSGQRKAARKGTMEAGRRERLDADTPGWNSTLDDAWDANADELVAFRAAHGTWPSMIAADPDEKRLGVWLGTQRTAARKDTLEAVRQERLDTDAPGWNSTRDDTWDIRAGELVAFRAAHGTWPSMKAADLDERRLGQWLGSQRTDARKDTLEEGRRERLDTDTPGWNNTFDDIWDANADELVAFRAAHGTWPGMTAADLAEKRLGKWLGNQRQAARKDTLEAGRRERLDADAPGWNSTLADVWDANADELVAFRAAHGTWPSKWAADPAEKRLGKWLGHQRTDARKGTLEAGRRERLDADAPGWLPRA